MSTPEAGVQAYFTHDHRDCDGAWAAVEQAAGDSDAAKTRAAWAEFSRRMDRHFRMEEETLFPAFEQATGMHGTGPTEVMRMEHSQMRGLLAQIDARVEAGDFGGVLDHGDTLMMLVAQHNAKEENMLYPMADNVLGGQWSEIAARIRASY